MTQSPATVVALALPAADAAGSVAATVGDAVHRGQTWTQTAPSVWSGPFARTHVATLDSFLGAAKGTVHAIDAMASTLRAWAAEAADAAAQLQQLHHQLSANQLHNVLDLFDLDEGLDDDRRRLARRIDDAEAAWEATCRRRTAELDSAAAAARTVLDHHTGPPFVRDAAAERRWARAWGGSVAVLEWNALDPVQRPGWLDRLTDDQLIALMIAPGFSDEMKVWVARRLEGTLDGRAAWQRDLINRALLTDDIASLEHQIAALEALDLPAADEVWAVDPLGDDPELADRVAQLDALRQRLGALRAIQTELTEFENARDPLTRASVGAQLYIYDPDAFEHDGLAAIALGDLDAAEHIAVRVPGMGTTVAGLKAAGSIDLYNEARWASDDGDSVAVLDWVGYDAPSGGFVTEQLPQVLTRDLAEAGAVRLAHDVDVLRGIRPNGVHLTVVGNSYGSTTSAIAADTEGLAADDLILTGSPGAGEADDANDLTTGREHTWIGSASHDPVTKLGVTGWTDPSEVVAAISPMEMMGNDPSEDEFHAQRFQAEAVDRGDQLALVDRWGAVDPLNFGDHSKYVSSGSESLYNTAAIVVGEYDEVLHADHRDDPWYAGLQDPELDRTPRHHTHDPEAE